MSFKFITSIPVYPRTYTFGIREGKLLLSNIDERQDYLWETTPIDVKTIEGYVPLVTSAKARLFFVSDESGANKWIVVETRHQALLVNSPWRDVVQWLRVNIVDLGEDVHYIRNMSLTYRMSLGNFYLYPELNPLNLPLRSHPTTLTIADILDSVDEVFNLKEIGSHFPIGKLSRFHRGILVSGPHLWWVDRKTNLAYYLNSYFFEGAIKFKDFIENGDATYVSNGTFRLPREENGEWMSPVVDSTVLSNLLENVDQLEINPATGTRIHVERKATNESSGHYKIPGYGSFGRASLSDKQCAWVRSVLGNCLGLEIRGERFVGLYNVGDIKGLFIREHREWVEPTVREPMIETPDPVNEDLKEAIDDVAVVTTTPAAGYQPQYPQGWQNNSESTTTIVVPETIHVNPTDVDSVAKVDLDIGLGEGESTDQEQHQETLTDIVQGLNPRSRIDVETTETDVEQPNVDESTPVEKSTMIPVVVVEQQILDLNGSPAVFREVESEPTSHGLKLASAEDVRKQIMLTSMVNANGPVIASGILADPNVVARPMLKGNIVLIDVGGVYSDLLPWKVVPEQGCFQHPIIGNMVDGEWLSCSKMTYLKIANQGYYLKMHVNLK